MGRFFDIEGHPRLVKSGGYKDVSKSIVVGVGMNCLWSLSDQARELLLSFVQAVRYVLS